MPSLLNLGLWAAQWMLAATFMWGAYMKLLHPISHLSTVFPWTADVPFWAVQYVNRRMGESGDREEENRGYCCRSIHEK